MSHNATISPVDEASNAEEELKNSLLQPVTEGAGPFISMCCACFLVGLVAPAVLLATEAVDNNSGVVAGAAFFVGILFCCTGMYHIFLPKPVKPPPLFPLCETPQLRVPKKCYVLVNAKGGTGSGVKIFNEIVKPKLDAAGIAFKRVDTEYCAHAVVLCKTLPLDAEGFDTIICIGGDGTFHECVNGMLDRTDGQKCPIGLIPGGSGNSFMTDFGLQKSRGAAMDNIVAGRVAGIDATRVVYGPDDATHHLWSINVVGFCADHCMAAVNIDSWRPLLGTARYDICALWGLLKGRLSNVDVVVDGKMWSTGVGAIFVNTTQHFGKGMRAAPLARLDDGLCDVGSIRGSRGHVLRMFSLIQTGQHFELMENVQGKQVELRLPTDMGVFNVDGEVTVHHHNRITLTVHPKAFEFYVPAKVPATEP